MRLVLFGTGPFAVPAYQALINSQHEIAALVTRPISQPGNRRKTAANPTRDLGQSHDLEIFDPSSINALDAVDRLRSYQADLFVVCDYGQILSDDALAAARLGGINLHGSILPKYRGAAPINWAIYHGESVMGVTIIHMTSKLDGGPCLVTAQTDVRPGETAEEIEPRLAQLGVQPVVDAIEMLEQWDGVAPIGQRQDPALATKAPRLKKQDGLIDWTRTADQIVNQIRAFQPWPGSYTRWTPEGKNEIRMIVHGAQVLENSSTVPAGEVVVSSKTELVVQTGKGQIALKSVQPAGKKAMPISDYLRGNPPPAGTQLG